MKIKFIGELQPTFPSHQQEKRKSSLPSIENHSNYQKLQNVKGKGYLSKFLSKANSPIRNFGLRNDMYTPKQD